MINYGCKILQIVRDELVKLMGGEVSELVFAKSRPTVILLAGLQGVGKTTVSAKLANYLKKQVHSIPPSYPFFAVGMCIVCEHQLLAYFLLTPA